MGRESGFTLVELMVVTAIVAILAAVATPAYINYINRGRQTDAIEAVLRGRMDQETFWSDNHRYANTIGCLYSFGNDCTKGADTSRSYRISISGVGSSRFIMADRWIVATGKTDTVRIRAGDTTPDTVRPEVVDPTALHFSIFEWIFD